MTETPAPRILTDIPVEEVAIFTEDGRVFYNMQAMASQWTMALLDAKVRAINEGSPATTHSYISGQAFVLTMILENIDVLLVEAGMPQHAIGMGDFDQMLNHFTSE